MLAQVRQQVSTFWDGQSRVQRLVLVTLVAAGIVLIALFTAWASTPSYSVAYNNLEEADAGLIVEKLNEENIPYQLRDHGVILVETDQVYDVRLMMARQGLPQGGAVGFEMFSGNTLGMTEFTQRVNFQQAMEGELERTIGSMTAVEAVRVHVVVPERTLLASEQPPATASITVKEKPGQRLDAAQVRAMTHLVASSVEGLDPENVVVVDVNGNMLASGEQTGEAGVAVEMDTRRAVEQQAAQQIAAKVQKLLDTALGPNKSVVQATVSMDWTKREKTTQSFEPNTIAVRSSQEVTETYTTTNAILEGVPGATPNLPPAGAGVTPENQAVNYNRVEHTTNYEVTQVDAYEAEAPGAIERVSLSVLVDGVSDTQALATLTSVIGAAAGIDTARGDLLAVETLAFDRTFYETQAAELADSSRTQQYIQIGLAVGAALLGLLLLWYVMRLLNNLKLAASDAWKPVMKPVAETALPGGMPLMQPHLQGMGAGIPGAAMAAAYGAAPQIEQYIPKLEPQPEPKPLHIPKMELPTISPELEQMQNLILQLADEDPSTLSSIIQLWLSEDDRGNG
jgi:flagellar M-ring protein FliF